MSWEKVPQWAHIMVNTLLHALRERDPYTYGHCRRVARNARLLAKAAGLNEDQQRDVEVGSLFHDIGKMGISDRILLKPGKLTAEEAAIMREHPVKSIEIIQPLQPIDHFKGCFPGVLHHHERIDGRGYPHGLDGEKIPLIARIILISDTFDAMTTNRPYRKGMAEELAYKELRQFSGRQFDADLVKIFLKAHPSWGVLEEEITEEFVASHFKRVA